MPEIRRLLKKNAFNDQRSGNRLLLNEGAPEDRSQSGVVTVW
jgi:hypothetical protein